MLVIFPVTFYHNIFFDYLIFLFLPIKICKKFFASPVVEDDNGQQPMMVGNRGDTFVIYLQEMIKEKKKRKT